MFFISYINFYERRSIYRGYLDQQILMKLKENARQSASDISKEIHLSVSTVIDRIRKMESSGVIESYTVITDEKKTGNDVTALMEISLEHPRYNELFIENIKKNPNIISCYYLTGEFDYLLKIACQSSEHLEQIHHWIKDQAAYVRPVHTMSFEPKKIFILLCRKQKSNNRKGFL